MFKFLFKSKFLGFVEAPVGVLSYLIVFAILGIFICVLVFVCGVIERSSICTFNNDNWVYIGIC